MDSRDRLQNALLEAQAQAKVSQAELAKVKAGAKSERLRLKQEIVPGTAKGRKCHSKATIARWQAEVTTANTDYNRYLSLYKEGAIAAGARPKAACSRNSTAHQKPEQSLTRVQIH